MYAAATRSLAIAILLSTAVPDASEAAGQIPYGTRAGMLVTIKAMDGIDTEKASIKVEHTRQNAKEFCVEYSLEQSEACVERTLKDVRINDVLIGNCRTAQFTNLRGEQRIFAGANLDHDAVQYSPEYRIFKKGERAYLDGSSGSGYPVDLEQFKALCPSAYAQAMTAFETRPKFIGRWYLDDKKICGNPDGAAEGLLTYTSREFLAIEMACKFTNVRAVGDRYEISMNCASEGQTSKERVTLGVSKGKLVRTITVDRKQTTFTYNRCPF
ncbi:hypothetical protein [Bradyrhizobium arachidis]|uniref:hypothetical protein n=1 Tax=Bradyrhizobium arachidis TaxID=858423 RepID=UPI002161BC54|nr:hypothetical protein [Bradyrhizobium arachidis]UVO26477.1 hypothetical protein KUF59_28455 [Bradyrhizobium arachidis]